MKLFWFTPTDTSTPYAYSSLPLNANMLKKEVIHVGKRVNVMELSTRELSSLSAKQIGSYILDDIIPALNNTNGKLQLLKD